MNNAFNPNETLYVVLTDNGTLVMIAPMRSIQSFYKLHNDAVARCHWELESKPSCSLYGKEKSYIISISVLGAAWQTLGENFGKEEKS